MRRLQVRRPVLLLAVLIAVLCRDHTGFVRMALAASLLHESGHVLAYRKMTGKFPVLRFSLTGIGLAGAETGLTPAQRLQLAAAGPLANFAACILLLLALQYRACYPGYFFAGANLCMGLFNLLPLGQLDGRRILQALRCSGRR